MVTSRRRRVKASLRLEQTILDWLTSTTFSLHQWFKISFFHLGLKVSVKLFSNHAFDSFMLLAFVPEIAESSIVS